MKSFVVRNGLQNAKSNTVLAAWNPPKEWGRLIPAMACSGYMSDVRFVAVCSIVLSHTLMAIKWNFAPAYSIK